MYLGLSFAICKAEPPYLFELCEGQFRSRSSYGRMEMNCKKTSIGICEEVVALGS